MFYRSDIVRDNPVSADTYDSYVLEYLIGVRDLHYRFLPTYLKDLDGNQLPDDIMFGNTIEFYYNRFTATRTAQTVDWIVDGEWIVWPATDNFYHISGYWMLWDESDRHLSHRSIEHVNYESWEHIGHDTRSEVASPSRIYRVVTSGYYSILEQGNIIEFVFPDGNTVTASFSQTDDMMYIGREDDVLHVNPWNAFVRIG